MKIAVRKEPNGSIYIDKNVYNDERFSERVLSSPPYNYVKVEIDDIYTDCIGVDFDDDLTFNIDKYNLRINKVKYVEELEELTKWFEEYDNQVKQYERCKRLGIGFDRNIEELDNQAVTNSKRISELRKLLAEEVSDVTNTQDSKDNRYHSL